MVVHDRYAAQLVPNEKRRLKVHLNTLQNRLKITKADYIKELKAQLDSMDSEDELAQNEPARKKRAVEGTATVEAKEVNTDTEADAIATAATDDLPQDEETMMQQLNKDFGHDADLPDCRRGNQLELPNLQPAENEPDPLGESDYDTVFRGLRRPEGVEATGSGPGNFLLTRNQTPWVDSNYLLAS